MEGRVVRITTVFMVIFTIVAGVTLFFLPELHASQIAVQEEQVISERDKDNAEVVNVAGNCDWGYHGAEDEELVTAAGSKIFLTHGHLYGVKSNPANFLLAVREKGANIGVFGHTHVAFIKKINGILLINPGSLSYPRDGKGQSFMVLELAEGKEPEIYHYHLQK